MGNFRRAPSGKTNGWNPPNGSLVQLIFLQNFGGNFFQVPGVSFRERAPPEVKVHKVLEVFSGGVFFFGRGRGHVFFNFRECVNDTDTSQFTKQFNG